MDTLTTDEDEILLYLKNRKNRVVVVEEVALTPPETVKNTKKIVDILRVNRQEREVADERAIRRQYEQMSSLYGLDDFIELEDLLEDYHEYGYAYAMKLIDDMVEDISRNDSDAPNDDYYA